jgi:hypothetical protein
VLGACAAEVLRHPRRDEVAARRGSAAAIGDLYAVEESIRGQLPEVRRRTRQARAGPKLAELQAWLIATLRKVPKKSELAGAYPLCAVLGGARTLSR